MSGTDMQLRITTAAGESDTAWLRDLWMKEWDGLVMVSRGVLHQLEEVQSILAWKGTERVGAATFHIGSAGCELLSLNALVEGTGVGSALLQAVEEAAQAASACRVWLITSNDNVDAMRFYQRRGYRFSAVYIDAITEARKLKPTIPDTGLYGISICDEVELAKELRG